MLPETSCHRLLFVLSCGRCRTHQRTHDKYPESVMPRFILVLFPKSPPIFPPWRRGHGFHEAPPPSSLRRLTLEQATDALSIPSEFGGTTERRHHQQRVLPSSFYATITTHVEHRIYNAASTSPEDHRSSATVPARTAAIVLWLTVSTPRT